MLGLACICPYVKSVPLLMCFAGHGVLDDDAYILKREQYEHVGEACLLACMHSFFRPAWNTC